MRKAQRCRARRLAQLNSGKEAKHEDRQTDGTGRADEQRDLGCDRRDGAGGNGNGGSGGGNAHGAATAGPTMGGDNTSATTSTHKGGFHFKHKKKAKPAADTAQ
ncbi:hypothetical protein [Candidatus Burkholderia verschuerenii]|uniref:hypothetical protein n=1 Tax=Candidatus Burkholderia verschuerenii TaxID=242163 RepID=UPI000ADEBCCF|nr:hypothetical protein [Candidatus Burkholderia verschuerenii]